jgi:hypothetical protein
VFALGSRLVDWPTPFARFTIGDLEQPGAFRWGDPALRQILGREVPAEQIQTMARPHP